MISPTNRWTHSGVSCRVMPNFVFWLSLPWVLPQALWVRRRTPRFQGPAGELCGAFGDQPHHRIIGVGDSIVAGVGTYSPDHTITAQLAMCWQLETGCATEWTAHGKIGARIGRIKRIVESLERDDRATLVLISVGVNDITSLTAVDEWIAVLASLVTIVQERFPQARIALLGIPPLELFPALPSPLKYILGWRATDFDRAARRYAESRPGVSYVPINRRPKPEEFSSDGFHPSAESYSILAREIVRVCRRPERS
jgi:lysophospholipase L1-like esterase